MGVRAVHRPRGAARGRGRGGGSGAVALLCLLGVADRSEIAAQAATLDRTWPSPDSAPVAVVAPVTNVRVDAWERGEVRVVLPDAADRYRVDVGRASGPGLIVAIEALGPFDARRSRSDTVFVTVPRPAPVSVRTYRGAIHMAGAEGDVTLESYFEEVVYRGGATRVSVRGFHAPIRIEAPRAASIVAESGGGDVNVLGGGGRVRVETVRGDIDVRGNGPLVQAELRSTGGSIFLSAPFTEAATIGLDSHHGTVELEVDPAAGARFRLETYLGAIENELGPSSPAWTSGLVRPNALDFSLGDGATVVTASTYRGDILIERRR